MVAMAVLPEQLSSTCPPRPPMVPVNTHDQVRRSSIQVKADHYEQLYLHTYIHTYIYTLTPPVLPFHHLFYEMKGYIQHLTAVG